MLHVLSHDVCPREKDQRLCTPRIYVAYVTYMLHMSHICCMYCHTMFVQRGRPKVTSNAAQLVIKYLLVNKSLLSKAWRTRLYYYSSGTLFAKVSGPLAEWLKDHEEHGDKYLRQMRDVDGLYQIIGDAIFRFMLAKPGTFPNANLSKEDFWYIPTWKRALTCMFLSRYVLKMPAQRPWNKFLLRDLKFNKRCINRCVSHCFVGGARG